MAFTDPQTITINAVPIVLPRVNTGNNASDYLSADGLKKLTASSAYGRRTRRVLRVDHAKVAADPFIPAQNVKLSMSCYIVFDTPVAGYTNAEAIDVWDGLSDLATADSHALVAKLLGGES